MHYSFILLWKSWPVASLHIALRAWKIYFQVEIAPQKWENVCLKFTASICAPISQTAHRRSSPLVTNYIVWNFCSRNKYGASTYHMIGHRREIWMYLSQKLHILNKLLFQGIWKIVLKQWKNVACTGLFFEKGSLNMPCTDKWFILK